MIITIQHVRAAKMCIPGAIAFCQRHDLSWRKLVKVGLDEGELRATGDSMALKVIEVAHGRQQQ